MTKRMGDIIRQLDRDVKPGLKNTDEHRGFCLALSEIGARVGEDHPILEAGDTFISAGAEITIKCPDCGDIETGEIKQGSEGFEVVIAPLGETEPGPVVTPTDEPEEPEVHEV